MQLVTKEDRVEQINNNYAWCAEYLPCPSDLDPPCPAF